MKVSYADPVAHAAWVLALAAVERQEAINREWRSEAASGRIRLPSKQRQQELAVEVEIGHALTPEQLNEVRDVQTLWGHIGAHLPKRRQGEVPTFHDYSAE